MVPVAALSTHPLQHWRRADVALAQAGDASTSVAFRWREWRITQVIAVAKRDSKAAKQGRIDVTSFEMDGGRLLRTSMILWWVVKSADAVAGPAAEAVAALPIVEKRGTITSTGA